VWIRDTESNNNLTYFPANENGLKWIQMNSNFQKYWFTNVKMLFNPECIVIHL